MYPDSLYQIGKKSPRIGGVKTGNFIIVAAALHGEGQRQHPQPLIQFTHAI